MGLKVEVEQLQAIVAVTRPLVRVTYKILRGMALPYDSLCLNVTLNGACDFTRHVWWSNMLARAFYLFEEFDGTMSTELNTTGYQARMCAPFTLSIDKPTPDQSDTMTTGREGPYEVNLRDGSCQCRCFAGHPWVIYEPTDKGKQHIAHGVEAKALENWESLKEWFPEYDLHRYPGEEGYFVDPGSDPGADCKHLVGTYLVACACIAHAEGLVDNLPEATQRLVARLVGSAIQYGLFPELK